jgi:hypothetical protein
LISIENFYLVEKKCRKFSGIAPEGPKKILSKLKEETDLVLFFGEKLYFQNSRLVVDM